MLDINHIGCRDLNRYFYLDKSEAVWTVIEIKQTTCICMMIGTEDCIELPQHVVARLIREYDSYWA